MSESNARDRKVSRQMNGQGNCEILRTILQSRVLYTRKPERVNCFITLQLISMKCMLYRGKEKTAGHGHGIISSSKRKLMS